MADHGVFLELMQLVDAGRKVRGKDSMEIRDEDVERAKNLDGEARAHAAEVFGTDHDSHLCEKCRVLHSGRVMLREKLHSQGQDFPIELLS